MIKVAYFIESPLPFQISPSYFFIVGQRLFIAVLSILFCKTKKINIDIFSNKSRTKQNSDGLS
jgi:hypothetical protein